MKHEFINTRIAKAYCIGRVTKAEIATSRVGIGYIRVKTDITKDFWCVMGRIAFVSFVTYLYESEDVPVELTREHADAVLKRIVGERVKIRWEVILHGDAIYYSAAIEGACHDSTDS